MKRILYIGNLSLKNPIRGTPLRVRALVRQIKKAHQIFVCADAVGPEFEDVFIKYPKGSTYSKLKQFIKVMNVNEIDTVLIATEVGIRVPVILKYLTGAKIVIDLHGLYGEELYFKGAIGRMEKRLYDFRTKFFLQFYDLVFTVSEKLKKYYLRINKNIEVVYGGVDANVIDQSRTAKQANVGRAEQDNHGTGFVIGYMGNARPYQGLDFLLKAASELRQSNMLDFRMNLVISGEDQEEFTKKLKSYGLFEVSDVNFDVPHETAHALISRSSVLVVPRPSIPMTEYAYPSKLPEDLATGIPVIMTRVGPVEELLKEADFCIIMGTHDIAADLANALMRFRAMSHDQRIEMGKRAAEFVKNNLSWDKLGELINNGLEKLK